MRTWEEYQKTARPENPLHAYARSGDTQAVQQLNPTADQLNAKDAKGYSSLMLAAYHGHEEMTRLLLGLGANPNDHEAGENSILMGAAFKGYLGIVRMLVAAGADVHYRNSKSMTAQNFAQMFGRADVVGYLQSLQQ